MIRIEQSLLVLLYLLLVCARYALPHREQVGEDTEDAHGLSTHQFHELRVLFLRHQTGTGCDGVAKFEETKFCCRVKNDVLSQSREVHHEKRRSADEFETEITVADRIQTVARNCVEAERTRYGISIDRVRSSS